MADKTTGGLPAVEEATIGSLPGIADLYDDTKIPVEQQGEARHMTGAQWKQYAKSGVSQYVEAAQEAANNAQQAASAVGTSAREAAASASAAQIAKKGAEAAREAIENMEVSANTLPPGNNATVSKTSVSGVVNLRFGIPKGNQGDVGPEGKQGIQGPPGKDGINGVSVPEAGQYAFNVDERGHLILSYTGSTAPNFSIEENGHLYLNIE